MKLGDNMKKFASLLLASAMVFAFAGCKTDTQTTTEDEETTAVEASTDNTLFLFDDMFTERDRRNTYDTANAVEITLSKNKISCDSTAVTVDGTTATITADGTYILSGSIDDGQIIVDVPDDAKPQLVLNNASITSKDSATIYVKNANKVFITTVEGTTNTLSTTNDFVAVDDENVNSVIYSKDDITLNGLGVLNVSTENGHGISSNDDMVITDGTYNIDAVKQALKANDSVRIAGGTFNLTSGKDGIHVENTEKADEGYIYIAGGTFDITSDGDCLDASYKIQIDDCTINGVSGGGYVNASEQVEDFGSMDFGTKVDNNTSTTETTDESASTKGIKAGGCITILDGTITLDCCDDAIHSNYDILIKNGTITLSSGDDGIHADSALVIDNGTIDIKTSYEGLEAPNIDINDGKISIVASDDGMNANSTSSTTSSGMGGGMMDADQNSYLKIAGGYIYVNAEGDGLDSNGYLYLTGGETYVDGPMSSGNGALDYGISASATNAIFVAVGAQGMAENLDAQETQGSMLLTGSGNAGDEIVLKDSDGNVLVSYTPQKSFQSILVSCPELQVGNTYTIYVGSASATIEMTALVMGQGSGMGQMGGMQGGMGGGMQGGMGGKNPR